MRAIACTIAGNARRLPPPQRLALVNLGEGALPWINRKRASPSTWVASITAHALVREGLATIRGSWLKLTPRGRVYARALAEREAVAA